MTRKKLMNIAYLRCSTSVQDTAHQKASIEAYCRQNNVTIDKTISDEAISAYRKDISARDGMLEVLDLAHKGMIENLVVFETSRISRQFIESQTVIDELTRCGVSIHSVSDNSIINQNELDALMIAFKSFMNMKASKETGIRVKSKQNQLKAEGLYYAGAVPWGFTVVDKRVVPDESLLEEMELFFDIYINYGTKAVMNRYGCTRLTVMNRIGNEKYKVVVGADKWNKANKLRSSRRCIANKTTTTNKSNALFEGMLYHACCGSKLYISYDNRTKGRYYYRCVPCRGDETITDKKSFSGTALDAHIESEILKVLDELNHEKLQEKYLTRCTKHRLVLELELKTIDNEINDCKTAITKANTKLSQYILDDANDNLITVISNLITTKKSDIAELELKKEDIQGRLDNLLIQEQHQEHMIDNVLEAKKIYAKASPVQKKAILHLLINRIEVKDINSVSIFLNI